MTKAEQPDEQKVHTIEEKSNGNKYSNSPQAPEDKELVDIGESVKDLKGEITLLDMTKPNQTHTIGPLEVTIEELKILDYYPSADLIDFFHGLAHDESHFNYAKLTITVKNTSDEQVDFAPIAILETSEGEKVSWEEEFYLEHLIGVYQPKQVKRGEVGFIIDDTQIEEMQWIKLHTSEIVLAKDKVIDSQVIQLDL